MLYSWNMHTRLRNMSFRLDRTAHYAGTHEENAHYHAAQQPATMVERLRAAAYPNSVAYGYDLDNPPRFDRTAFAALQHITETKTKSGD